MDPIATDQQDLPPLLESSENVLRESKQQTVSRIHFFVSPIRCQNLNIYRFRFAQPILQTVPGTKRVSWWATWIAALPFSFRSLPVFV